VCRLSIALILAVACSTTIAQTPAAKPPAASPPAAGVVASGQAAGTLTAKGKTIKLAYAYAFVEEGDKKRPVILLLTEQQVPVASWKGDSEIMMYRMRLTLRLTGSLSFAAASVLPALCALCAPPHRP
jgi:hypothetical protein